MGVHVSARRFAVIASGEAGEGSRVAVSDVTWGARCGWVCGLGGLGGEIERDRERERGDQAQTVVAGGEGCVQSARGGGGAVFDLQVLGFQARELSPGPAAANAQSRGL